MVKQYLVASDFDGTIAKTFEKSPNNIGVNEAYQMAVEKIFGSEGAQTYAELGGLRNKAPGELVNDLIAANPNLVSVAQRFFEENRTDLENAMAVGKGVKMEWNPKEPGAVIGEMLVRTKLSFISDQIGTEFADGRVWPQPCDGFIDSYKKIQELKAQGIEVDFSILSSGHDEFIRKVFQLWKLECPDLLVTDDDMRGRPYPRDDERRVKPSSALTSLIHLKWMQAQGKWIEDIDFKFADETRERMVMVGDDPVKDGQLARNYEIPFLWYNPEGKQIDPAMVKEGEEGFAFKDWGFVSETLQDPRIREGMPIREVLFERNKELTENYELLQQKAKRK